MILNFSWSSLAGHTQNRWSVILNQSYDIATLFLAKSQIDNWSTNYQIFQVMNYGIGGSIVGHVDSIGNLFKSILFFLIYFYTF